MNKLFVCALIFAFAAGVAAQETAVKPKGNVCYVESVEVQKGTSFPVKVFVNNVDTLAGMQVPIYYRSEDVDLTCDSISFIDTRCKGFALSLPLAKEKQS